MKNITLIINIYDNYELFIIIYFLVTDLLCTELRNLRNHQGRPEEGDLPWVPGSGGLQKHIEAKIIIISLMPHK